MKLHWNPPTWSAGGASVSLSKGMLSKHPGKPSSPSTVCRKLCVVLHCHTGCPNSVKHLSSHVEALLLLQTVIAFLS